MLAFLHRLEKNGALLRKDNSDFAMRPSVLARNIDKSIGSCVFPGRKPGAGRSPSLHRLGIGPRSTRDPGQELQQVSYLRGVGFDRGTAEHGFPFVVHELGLELSLFYHFRCGAR